jgi:hypothetical protein
MTEIIIAVLTGVFALASIIVTSRRKIKELQVQNNIQSNEIKFRADTLALKVNMQDWSAITESLKQLMKDTCIDRFFILMAFNGQYDPKWTTALYQVMQNDDKIISYVHFGIDDDYVSRLQEIRHRGQSRMTVSEIPDSIIRSVYHTEGVLASAWFHISEKLHPGGSVGINYASFSTHSEHYIDDSTMERCAVIVNQIKGALARAEI